MRIAIPVAQYHEGNTSDYVLRAFKSLGHEAEIITCDGFSSSFHTDKYDLFFGVDSGEPFPFSQAQLSHPNSKKLAFWFIDYRHNKNRATRNPPDEVNAKLLNEMGAWIFQAQHEDVEECKKIGISRVTWLPVGADVEIWSDTPKPEEKRFDVGFVGNVWDRGRADALELIVKSELRFGFLGHGKIWKEQAAALLRECKIGFNISSYFGSAEAFDINMRFFETLSCGIPLITNEVPSLHRIFDKPPPFIRTYRRAYEILPVLREALQAPPFLATGETARAWVKDFGTYEKRMSEVLKIMMN